MTDVELTTSQVAHRLGCSLYKVRTQAQRLGVGINLGGRAGFRFTEPEYQRLRESMRVLPQPARRRRRRVS